MPFEAAKLAAPPVKTQRRIAELDRAIAVGIQTKLFTAAQCVASVKGSVFHRSFVGDVAPPPPKRSISQTSLFDLDALTMPLCTAVAVQYLVGSGRLDINKKVGQISRDFNVPPFDAISLDMLLDHSSGLPANVDLTPTLRKTDRHLAGDQKHLGTRRAIPMLREAVRRVQPMAPPGTQTCVSPLGFLLLGWMVEEVVGEPLGAFVAREIFKPLRLDQALLFTAPAHPAPQPQFVTSANCPQRNKVLQGQVHDFNSHAQGGGAGHAGLFGDATAVWQLCQTLLLAYLGKPTLFHTATQKRFWTRSRRFETTRTLGWDTPTMLMSNAGSRLPRTAVGHVAPSGPAIWIDPHHEIVGVFLCNATPGRDAELLKLRSHLFELVASYAAKGPPPGDGAEVVSLLMGH